MAIPRKKPKITKKVARASYKKFLETPYWEAVRTAVINRDGKRCTKCGSTKRLQAHHKTYEHHGKEHLHLGDLTTLCQPCHKAVHKRQKSLANAKKARRN